jgi:CysZ protein
MLDDAIRALTQMLSPPLRAVLWKSIGLACLLIVALAAALERAIVWLVEAGSASAQTALGPHAHLPLDVLAWLFGLAAGLGIVAGSVMLMPAVTAFVASFFADQIAEEVERTDYPADPPGRALPLSQALFEGGKAALLAIAVYLCTLPLLLIGGVGAILFFLATAWLLGRVYFELAAMRFVPVAEAKALRRRHATTVFIGGMLIALFVSIPIVSLATPLFAMAFMAHMHKRLSRRELVGADRRYVRERPIS